MSYKNIEMEPKKRAEKLLADMSLEEKIAQIQSYGMYELVGITAENPFPYGVGEVTTMILPMLYQDKESMAKTIKETQDRIMASSPHHIPALFHAEALTGVIAPEMASFPTGIGQASTWNVKLQKEMSTLIGKQAKAVGVRHVLSPVFDISRDPRFGRQAESYGEDPTLASAMGTAFVQGVQGNGDLKEGVAATGKHFIGFMAGEGGIHASRTPIPSRTLREVYGKPFQAAITEGGIESIMNSYATLDGEPVCGSSGILRTLLCDEMGFEGVTVSDYMSVEQLKSVHKVAETNADAGQLALEAGMNSELPTPLCFTQELADKIRTGKMNVEALNDAVLRILTLKFKLGLFENPYPDFEMLMDATHDKENEQLMLQAARESMVLLRNDGVLPLQKTYKKIAVIGYHGNSTRALFGGYTYENMKEGTVGVTTTMAGVENLQPEDLEKYLEKNTEKQECYKDSKVVKEKPEIEAMSRQVISGIESLYENMKKRCHNWNVEYAYGYDYAGTDEGYFEEAYKTAEDADLVIVTIGGHYGGNVTSTSGEGVDMKDIGIPKVQERFLTEFRKRYPEKELVAVHFDGHPCSSDVAEETCNAILEAWAPAQKGSEAVVDILLGEYNPSGHLPVCAATDAGQLPVYYGHERGAAWHTNPSIGFNEYVDGSRKPRYMFGYGLSYTTFELSDFRVSQKCVLPQEKVKFNVMVKNTGDRAGECVVQLYFEDLFASVTRPNMELAGFAKITLLPGEKKMAEFEFDLSQCAFLDKNMKWKIEKGTIRFMIGTAADEIIEACDVEIKEDLFIDGKTRSCYCIGNEIKQ